jgi:hypothetical protein
VGSQRAGCYSLSGSATWESQSRKKLRGKSEINFNIANFIGKMQFNVCARFYVLLKLGIFDLSALNAKRHEAYQRKEIDDLIWGRRLFFQMKIKSVQIS